MKRIAAGFALAAALLGSTLAGTALGQPDFDSRFHEREDSDSRFHGRGNGYGWGQGRFHRMNLEGRWVADNHQADFRGGPGLLGTLLPNFIRIDQRPSMVRIANRRNQPLQRIMIGGKFDSRYGNAPDFNADYFIGHWRGNTLVVQHTGRRGAMITQTFTLENRGRSLVVRTKREGRGWRGAIEFTNIYHRA